MNAFDKLKAEAQSVVRDQEVKQEGWLKANRKALLISGIAVAVIWFVVHHWL